MAGQWVGKKDHKLADHAVHSHIEVFFWIDLYGGADTIHRNVKSNRRLSTKILTHVVLPKQIYEFREFCLCSKRLVLHLNKTVTLEK